MLKEKEHAAPHWRKLSRHKEGRVDVGGYEGVLVAVAVVTVVDVGGARQCRPSIVWYVGYGGRFAVRASAARGGRCRKAIRNEWWRWNCGRR